MEVVCYSTRVHIGGLLLVTSMICLLNSGRVNIMHKMRELVFWNDSLISLMILLWMQDLRQSHMGAYIRVVFSCVLKSSWKSTYANYAALILLYKMVFEWEHLSKSSRRMFYINYEIQDFLFSKTRYEDVVIWYSVLFELYSDQGL